MKKQIAISTETPIEAGYGGTCTFWGLRHPVAKNVTYRMQSATKKCWYYTAKSYCCVEKVLSTPSAIQFLVLKDASPWYGDASQKRVGALDPGKSELHRIWNSVVVMQSITANNIISIHTMEYLGNNQGPHPCSDEGSLLTYLSRVQRTSDDSNITNYDLLRVSYLSYRPPTKHLELKGCHY